ncbi:branched-chain amino acid aminotransferase [Taklimakanibacter deserti]|uniref:branched-chain amino acid aminotransferase n=1 Tax=Taklimakanibacter deserti TaxID=2267839 RepID=UPI000E64CE13
MAISQYDDSKWWTYLDGKWHQGNPPIMGPWSDASWLGSAIFDGARAFEGVTPDLDLHCQRCERSALAFGLEPLKAGAIEELVRDGIGKFPKNTPLYLRPMFWAETNFLDAGPIETRYSISVHESAMPSTKGFSAGLSSFRRPSYEYAPTDAKAACHYANSARAIREAQGRGFDNAVLLDAVGNVSEFSTSNLFHAKDGEVHTPIPNGTLLNGITRQRVIKLLRKAGVTVHERAVPWRDVLAADEVFSTGNYGKVIPVTRIETRDLQPGPLFKKARELYWEFAHGG